MLQTSRVSAAIHKAKSNNYGKLCTPGFVAYRAILTFNTPTYLRGTYLRGTYLRGTYLLTP
jgi:hypothetical protein